MNRPSVIGIDIGGSKTHCLIADDKFRVICSETFRTRDAKGQGRFLNRIATSAARLEKAAKKKGLTIVGAGVACAGLVDQRSGVVKHAPHIPWLEKFPFRDTLKKRLKLPVTVGNDVHCGLYAEHQLGAARGCEHVLGVFFGTGVGGALILNGKLFEGAYGLGGQVGCLTVHAAAHPREVHLDGMLDRIAGKASIFGAALGLASKDWAPNLRRWVGTDLAQIEWHILAKSIKAGDRLLEDLLRSRLHTAGAVLANVVNFIGPQMVLLGGGLTEDLPKLVLQEIERGMRPRLVPEFARKVRIAAAQLENQAGALGAAKRAFESVRAGI